MAMTTSATQTIKGLEISALVTGGFRYVSVIGSTAATNASVLNYFNYGSGVGAWRNAVVTTPGGFNAPANSANIDNIVAMAFSPNFASDYMAVALSEQIGGVEGNGTLSLHVLSFNSLRWDNIVASGYPVAVTAETGNLTITVNKASVALGPDYMGGDETLRMAFVGADITGTAVTGGVWRCNDSTAARKIFDTAGINSIAYDGTSLAAGAYGTNNVYRSSDPLSATPTFTGARSLKKIGIDATTNDQVQVMYIGATLFGAKQGTGGAMSKSLDAGNTWNDFTLINMSLTFLDDVLPSADGATWYLAVRDANLSCIFRMSPMQRVLCEPVATANDLMLRGISTDANVVYAADKGGTTIYYSADGGVSRWQQRLNVPATIADMTIESQNVVYFGSGVNVYKSINNGFTWNLPVNTTMSSGAVYTMLSLGENKLLVGTTTGGVLWSKDGATTWTRSLGLAPGSTNAQVAATGLETGNFVFAAPGSSKAIWRCEIGPSNPINEFKDMSLTTVYPQTATAESTTGLMLVGGVLYALSANISGPGPTYLNSTLTPTINPAGVHPTGSWRTQYNSASYSSTTNFTAGQIPSALKASTSTGKITLWTLNTNSYTGHSMATRYFEDTLALTGPTISAPADKALVQTNSITGLPLSLVLMWARPSMATSYDIWVSTDSAFNTIFDSYTGYAGVDGTRATMSVVLGTGGSTYYSPGNTYYWKVRANSPITSAWSETRTFTIQPVAAAVPAISSPVNGATILSQSPAFSWSPVTSTTKYEFQLSTTPTFGTTVLTDTPASAGTLVPVTIKLEQGKQYFWRVRALEPVQGDWSTVANFIVATPAPPAEKPVTITQVPAPVITIQAAPTVPPITLKPADVTEIAPTYIWAIIIIGAILVIAVIVLIVRTRRSA
jgi:hypothetical protein